MLTTEYMDKQLVTVDTQAGGGPAVAGPLNGAKLVYGTNVISPGKNTVLADLTQSPDANLAPAALTWQATGRDASGDINTTSDDLLMQLALDANACVINSLALVDSGGTHVLASEDISANPMNLVDTLSQYQVAVEWAPGNPQGKRVKISG